MHLLVIILMLLFRMVSYVALPIVAIAAALHLLTGLSTGLSLASGAAVTMSPLFINYLLHWRKTRAALKAPPPPSATRPPSSPP